MGVNHGGTRGTSPPRILSGDDNTNCPPDFVMFQNLISMTFQLFIYFELYHCVCVYVCVCVCVCVAVDLMNV